MLEIRNTNSHLARVSKLQGTQTPPDDLYACQARVTAGHSGLCCCTCVTYFERYNELSGELVQTFDDDGAADRQKQMPLNVQIFGGNGTIK